jgi:hypothetical protein
MELTLNPGKDRVRKVTSEKINEEISKEIKESVQYYSTQNAGKIKDRLKKLDEEWDIERTLELNASLVALCGVISASIHNKRWLILSGIVTGFLAQHAIQGWCPPIPLFRRLGIRTQKEIGTERHGLLVLLERTNS